VQVGELSEHFTIFGIQSLDECGIVELGLTVRFAHVAKRVQALQEGLTPQGGQLLPARKQRLADVSLLLGRHLLPHTLPIAQGLLLIGSQAVPGLEALANLRLLFRRQTQETLIVPQELFLPARGHILKPLDGLGGQIVRIAPGRQSIGQPGSHPRLRSGTRLCTLLLGGRVESLPIRGAAQESRHKPNGQNSTELGSPLHYLVSLLTSSGDSAGETGSSESASNFEMTS
jgi:hypothetical protein